jgi:hypothetical protein
MGQDDMELDNRDLFFLGTLAARNRTDFSEGKLPRGCDAVQAEALVQAGFLTKVVATFADGHRETQYRVTRKGMDAWRRNGFVDPLSRRKSGA